jgi:hypothetical protein
MDPVERKKLDRYIGLRGVITAAYYSPPRSRRWAAFQSLESFAEEAATSERAIQRRPLGAMLVAEITAHPWKYPSLQLPRDPDAQNLEATLAAALARQMERITPTFAEDRALREAIRECAGLTGMGVLAAGKVTLANRETIALDPGEDSGNLARRNAWLLDKLSGPQTQPAESRPTP